MTGAILSPGQRHAGEPARLGGKAASLLALTRHGLPVPPWFCVSADAFAAATSAIRPAVERLLQGLDGSSPRATADCAARIRELFDTVQIPGEVEAAIRSEFAARGLADARLAVRSSAIGEDSASSSFAGLFDSFLGVRTRDVVDRVSACWASTFSERAIAYRLRNGSGALFPQMAVVIQEMIDARVSGIVFTTNPVVRSDELVVVAGYGLGEGAVSGNVGTDTYVLTPDGTVLRREIARKRQRVMLGRNGRGTTVARVPDALAKRPALRDHQLAQLAALSKEIKGLRNADQDIEWALDHRGRFWITQSRPVTTAIVSPPVIFDNSNIVEGYPGVTLPLTFSLVRDAYESLFGRAARRLGGTKLQIDAHASTFKTLVGYIEGRVYYNLSSWYELFNLLPWADRYRRAWNEMMGVRKGSGETTSQSWKRAFADTPTLIRIALRLVLYLATLNVTMRHLRRRFRGIHEEFWTRDLRQRTPLELAREFDALRGRLLEGWEITLFNDLFAIIFTASSRALILRAHPGSGGELFNGLLCGEAGIEAAEPVYSLVRLAETVRDDVELRSEIDCILEAARRVAVCDVLRQASPPFACAFDEHLRLYGDRCREELKLETIGYREDPAALLRVIRDYADSDLTISGLRAREREIRSRAEATLSRHLGVLRASGWLLRGCLALARRSVRYRENARLDRARSFGMLRAIFLEFGRQFSKLSVLEAPRDIFYLTVDEVISYAQGTSVNSTLSALVAGRKTAHVNFQKRDPPSRLKLTGVPYTSLGSSPDDAPSTEPGATVWRGVGCAAGEVTAEALVVHDPAAPVDPRGKVLVAESTDPGWVFLMVSAKGLVAERGSILSHTAIIGRELGIPTVVGVSNATRAIENGATIRINGGTGEVALIASPVRREVRS